MALAGALCVLVHTVVGFTNRSLCAQVRSLLGGPYTSTQTTYDLRRLRLKGLIRRLDGQNRYVLTPEGVRVAAFYTKVHRRLLEPLLEADKPPAPIELRRALRTIDTSVEDYVAKARIRPAA
jgi:predicted MarR family transcription regulator